jgi:hypothetical protein
MRKSVWLFVTAVATASAALTVACGDDDSVTAGAVDAGNDTGVTPADGGPPVLPPDAAPKPDAGGCTFATYVIGLVNGSTNATAAPDTTLGATCTDSTSQDEFKSLFP